MNIMNKQNKDLMSEEMKEMMKESIITKRYYDKKTELIKDCPLTRNKMNYKKCTGISGLKQCEFCSAFDTSDCSVECSFGKTP